MPKSITVAVSAAAAAAAAAAVVAYALWWRRRGDVTLCCPSGSLPPLSKLSPTEYQQRINQFEAVLDDFLKGRGLTSVNNADKTELFAGLDDKSNDRKDKINDVGQRAYASVIDIADKADKANIELDHSSKSVDI